MDASYVTCSVFVSDQKLWLPDAIVSHLHLRTFLRQHQFKPCKLTHQTKSTRSMLGYIYHSILIFFRKVATNPNFRAIAWPRRPRFLGHLSFLCHPHCRTITKASVRITLWTAYCAGFFLGRTWRVVTLHAPVFAHRHQREHNIDTNHV